VSQSGGVRFGAPASLFQLFGSAARSDFSTLPWDVTADGKRFLIGKTKALSESVTVVLNWSSELNNR
jgi:hypothetical protein